MTRVWDPGQSWCANSSILQYDSAVSVALSSNYTHFYIVERSLSFYLTTLISKATRLTCTRNVLVFLLAWHAENKARYMDMRILETYLLKVNVFASLGTPLLWKDNFGLAPVAKYLCSFWSASIMLILAYFHRCKSEGLDTTKPLVSRSAFLVLTRLVFSVGLGEQSCATYSIQVVVVFTFRVGIFDFGAGNDLPTRYSTDAKIIVPLIVV
ncbi:hypothetical protein R3W88_006662 [Solanum pinnatisectum]|uniref:Uncharacterized protein n=1 Tax=Solanum pinnatisectum TaxID=50273 RepID=A0AAV9KFM1_9SOLN|nr:hypothetical protein R3W88_006662 [Solanum pinnatisectum]